MSIPFRSDMMGKEAIEKCILTNFSEEFSEEEKAFLHVGRKEFIDRRIKKSPLCRLRDSSKNRS